MQIRKKEPVGISLGKYKGRNVRVLECNPKRDRILVEGVNMMKRHTRPSQRSQQGGIVEREAAMHISNVAAWCDTAKKPSKIIMKRLEDGSRVRVFKINGETLD